MRALVTTLGLAAICWMLPATLLAGEAQAAAPSLDLSASAAYAGTSSTVVVTLTDADGEPIDDEPVIVERRLGDTWTGLPGPLVTSESGSVATTVTLSRSPADNTFRARYAGDATHEPSQSAEVRALLLKYASFVEIRGPGRIVDETTVTLSVAWQTIEGLPVPGQVRLYRYRHGAWSRLRDLTLTDGKGSWSVAARSDTRWRVIAPAQPWVLGDRSPVHVLDNVPPAPRVALPSAAPRPRITLPPQPRAVGAGPNAVVRRIPDAVWRSMTGRSWHRGCPVGRGGLRLIRINYWAFDGYRRRGELVVAAGATGKFVRAFSSLYAQRLPLRSMYRADRFGWSDRLRGADDYRSMAADNTSVFNCRWVVNNPGVRSPHSYGRAVDLNTWENPYLSRTGAVPNSWWLPHSHRRVAWRSGSHRVVETMRAAGFAWTYGKRDTQHFDARSRSARMDGLLWTCGLQVCE